MPTRHLHSFRRLLAALLLAGVAAPAWATTRTVTSAGESGPGSLREILGQVDPGDTIVFDLGESAVIPVTSKDLVIDEDLTIIGPGAERLWLDGQSRGRTIFNIVKGRVEIRGLGIRNSSYWAIWNRGGDLTLHGMTFENNRAPQNGKAGAILNITTLSVGDSMFRGNAAAGGAGAVLNVGEATIVRSSFVDNTSSDGGAIINDGTMVVDASTFADNVVVAQFGGSGGAIRNNGQLAIRDSTFTGNHCTGAGCAIHNHTAATLTITASTLADNDAPNSPGASAIFRYGPVSIGRSIIAGSCGGGAPTSLGDNLGTGGGCVTDVVATNDRNVSDIALDPLAGNGGPTQTRLLRDGSPALDAVLVNAADCIGTDQRGLPRRSGIGCDIGAVEMTAIIVFGDGF